MSVNYGMLRGSIINALPYKSGTDHYQIEVNAAGKLYRIAVDVYSVLAGTKLMYATNGQDTLDTDRMVMFYKDENYKHPVCATMLQTQPGFTPKTKLDKKLLLDYLRYDPVLFPVDKMKIVPPKKAGAQQADNLNDDIDPWIQKAKNNADAEVFAFGSEWDDTAAGSKPDPNHYFTPEPKLGMHDIHMNQGDTGHEAVNNGAMQDGALFIHFKKKNLWVAMFFRFQNQSIHTDNHGNPVK